MQESLEGWERKRAQEVQQWRSISCSRTLEKRWGRSPFYRQRKCDRWGQKRLGSAVSSAPPEFSPDGSAAAEKPRSIPVRRAVRRAGIVTGIFGVQPGAAELAAELSMTENGVYENGDNFCVRTPILANLDFLKS